MQFLIQQTLQQQYQDTNDPDIFNVPETKVINSKEYLDIINLKFINQKIWRENKLVVPDVFYKDFSRFEKLIITDKTIYCDFSKESEFKKNFFELRDKISKKIDKAKNPKNKNCDIELSKVLAKGKWDLEDRRKYEAIITSIIKEEIDKLDFFKFTNGGGADNRDLAQMKKGDEFDCEHNSILYGLMLQFVDQKLLPEIPDYDAGLRRVSNYLYTGCKTNTDNKKSVGGHAVVFSSLTRSIIDQSSYYHAVSDYTLKDLYDGRPIIQKEEKTVYSFCKEDAKNYISGKEVRNKAEFSFSITQWYKDAKVNNYKIKLKELRLKSLITTFMDSNILSKPHSISDIEVQNITNYLKTDSKELGIGTFKIINNKIGDDYIKFNDKSYKVLFDETVKKGTTTITL